MQDVYYKQQQVTLVYRYYPHLSHKKKKKKKRGATCLATIESTN